MRLYKRENSPFWWYDFSFNGKRYRDNTKRPLADRAAARLVMMNAYNAVLNREQLGMKADLSLREAMEMTNDTVSGSTLTSYNLSMRKLCGDPPFETGYWHLDPKMPMSSLTQDHIDLLKKEREGEGLKPNSILIELRYIQRVYNLCQGRYNVQPGIKFSGPAPTAKTRYLTTQEDDAVMAELLANKGNPSYDKALDLYLFLLDTGARLNEALGLDWSDVDFLTETIELYRPKTKGLTKVPMSTRLKANLERRHNQATPFEGMSRAVKVLRKIMHKVCNQNKRIVERKGTATLHTLRDTFATRLLARGMSLKKVSGLLGHSNIRMTEKYAHLENDGVVDEARELLNQ